MRVHPIYHNSPKYIEPETYGFAKYNIHYHELVKTDTAYYYQYFLGEPIALKDLCGNDLIHNGPAYITGIVEDRIYISSTITDETSKTKVEVPASIYYRVSTKKNKNYLYESKKSGFIAPQSLEGLTSKAQNIHFNLAGPFFFFLPDDWYLRYVEIIASSRDSLDITVEHYDSSSDTYNTLMSGTTPLVHEPNKPTYYPGADFIKVYATNSSERISGNTVTANFKYYLL